MKVKIHEPVEVVRATILKKGEESATLTFEDTSVKEVADFIETTLNETALVKPCYTGKQAGTSIQIRKYLGKDIVGESENFRVFFWNPHAIQKIIMGAIK